MEPTRLFCPWDLPGKSTGVCCHCLLPKVSSPYQCVVRFVAICSFFLCCCCSVTQPFLILCNPTDCNTPGFPVLHYLSGFTQTHVHWISDAIQPSHPLSPSSPSAFSLCQHQGLFQLSQLFASGGHSIGVSVSAPVLPKSIQGWFPLRLTSLISLLSKGLLRVFSSTTIQSINSSALCLLYCPALTLVHDYWKDHSLDYKGPLLAKWCLCFLTYWLHLSWLSYQEAIVF